MTAPPTYRALVRREEQRRIAEREAAGKCIACGVNDRTEGSLLCVDHRTDLDRQSAHARDLSAPLPSSPAVTIEAFRRRGEQ